MKVAFLHIGPHDQLAKLMVQSVKDCIKSAEVIHLTDLKTRMVEGSDKIIRFQRSQVGWLERQGYDVIPSGMMIFRMKVMAEAMTDSPTIILDTDCIVQKDIGDVFAEPFDIALTKRTKAIISDTSGDDVTKDMPYNTGVMFSRRKQFWVDCLNLVRQMPQEHKDWYGDQLAVAQAVKNYHLLELPVDPYNYTPGSNKEDVSNKAVVHYKGKRKEWMKARFAQSEKERVG